ncbi:uncharacterized protein LOC124265100 [Haliotis rubra]|uniref:uncharacterized protein LOC124265100 n=1 Tax=Haliotis rubra TaxID=36100 RepID=UPI001EE5F44A|nr:uncharacterized protein LOC124265100 [Haliotis rubra]
MELSTVVFYSLLLSGIRGVFVDASLADLATRVSLVEGEINAWKLTAVTTDAKLINKFKVLKSSLKEELTRTFLPPLITPLVKQAITEILNEDYIGNIISAQVLDEVHILKANLHNTKSQLIAVTQELRHAERERNTYRKSLTRLRGRLTKDIRALQRQFNLTVADLGDARMLKSELNQTNDDLFETKQQITGLTDDLMALNKNCCGAKQEIKESDVNTTSNTTYPGTTAASTDPSPSKTVPPVPMTTQDSDLPASTDPSPTKTVPPAPETTQDSDLSATPSQADRDLYSACTDGDLGTVRWILTAGHVDINSRGGWRRRTAVMEAARWGHRYVVELLVRKGADVSLLDKYRRNILHYACLCADVETVKLILSLNVVDINSRWRSKTPVMAAAGEEKEMCWRSLWVEGQMCHWLTYSG